MRKNIAPGRPMSEPRTPFEANLRGLMSDAGIDTYRDLATAAGTTPGYINELCSGDKTIGITTAAKLAAALGVSIEKLLIASGSPTTKPP